MARYLERQGLLVRDAENAYLEWDGEEASPLDDLVGHAITYRVAVGPHRGQKAFTLQTVPAVDSDMETTTPVASASGFSLHAGVAAKAHQRDKLERLCRYISRPAVAEPRLSLTDSGHIRYSHAALAHPCARGICASLHGKDTLARWHHARSVRAAGFHRSTRRSDSTTKGESHAVPRHLCTEFPLACTDHPIEAWQAAR